MRPDQTTKSDRTKRHRKDQLGLLVGSAIRLYRHITFGTAMSTEQETLIVKGKLKHSDPKFAIAASRIPFEHRPDQRDNIIPSQDTEPMIWKIGACSPDRAEAADSLSELLTFKTHISHFGGESNLANNEAFVVVAVCRGRREDPCPPTSPPSNSMPDRSNTPDAEIRVDFCNESNSEYH